MSYVTNTGIEATYADHDEYCDEDVARDEDNYDGPYGGGPCTCGYSSAMTNADVYDYEYPAREGFTGCAGCDPVMHDSCPYGWGIEPWEDLPMLAARRGMGPSLEMGLLSEATYDLWLSQCRTVYSARRARHAEMVWYRICDEAKTHTEAIRAYARWAQRAITVRYRDDVPGRAAFVCDPKCVGNAI